MVEIYIPEYSKKGKNAQAGHFTIALPALEPPLPKSQHELEFLAEEIGKTMERLRASNDEMRGMLETEDDADLRQAIEENIVILEKNERKRQKVEAELKKFDHGYGMTI